MSLGQIQYLSLPIPTATAGAAIALPILTGIGIQGAQSLLTRSDDSLLKRRPIPSWLIPTLFVFLTVYETVVATLSVAHVIPSGTLACQLSNRWQTLFEGHNADAIRRIQDAHHCCGFQTARHMAWPFPDNHGANACRNMYHRETSCLGSWRHDQQIYAGLILLVAVASFLIKVGVPSDA